MTPKFIQDTVTNILDLDQGKYYTAARFIKDWEIAGKAIEEITSKEYAIELTKLDDNCYIVRGWRWKDEDAVDWVYTQSDNQARAILETLIKICHE